MCIVSLSTFEMKYYLLRKSLMLNRPRHLFSDFITTPLATIRPHTYLQSVETFHTALRHSNHLYYSPSLLH